MPKIIESDILRKVKQIHIRTRHMVNELFGGQYHSVFKGRGVEFEEVREYQPGDDIRSIDWNVTARTGYPHIKKFVEERELVVMLLLDASASGLFGSGEKTKREYAAHLGAVLALSAIDNNDKVGLIIFTDEIEKYIPPNKGKKHVLRVIREILYFAPKSQKTDISLALKTMMKITKRKSVCFLISDFFSENYEKELKIARKRHDLVAISVTDPREYKMPDVGGVALRDLETGKVRMIDTRDKRVRGNYEKMVENYTRQRRAILRSHKVDFIETRTDEDYITPLKKFFYLREKRKAR